MTPLEAQYSEVGVIDDFSNQKLTQGKSRVESGYYHSLDSLMCPFIEWALSESKSHPELWDLYLKKEDNSEMF